MINKLFPYFHIKITNIKITKLSCIYKITKIGAYAGIISGLLVVGISTLVISLNSGFSAAAAKSPEMGVAAMAVSMVIVPLVSAFTKNKDAERVEAIFACYNEE